MPTLWRLQGPHGFPQRHFDFRGYQRSSRPLRAAHLVPNFDTSSRSTLSTLCLSNLLARYHIRQFNNSTSLVSHLFGSPTCCQLSSSAEQRQRDAPSSRQGVTARSPNACLLWMRCVHTDGGRRGKSTIIASYHLPALLCREQRSPGGDSMPGDLILDAHFDRPDPCHYTQSAGSAGRFARKTTHRCDRMARVVSWPLQ